MLTIKPPIRLRCQTELTALHQDMDEKIRSNYSLMNESIRREELLYLTTSTPEMYFSEGSNTNVLNEITTQSRQEFRLDVINNLVNRIMLSNTDNFCYQDSVYISNVLRKIGITDVNSFMKQVSLLQSETKQTNRLLNLYEDNRQLLTKLFEQEQKKDRNSDNREPDGEVTENKYYLHEEIFNRLSTGKIYQEITSFANASARTENYITHNQMSVAEQTMQSENFRLQELKTSVFKKSAPMNFYHANTYELADTEEKTTAQQDERLTPAILLNLVDQAYSIKSRSIEQNSHRWYSLVTSLYESARNTIQRFDSYRRDGIYNSTMLNEAIVSINEQRKAEVNALTLISNEFSDVSFAIKKYENNLGLSFEEISRRFENVQNMFSRKDITEQSQEDNRSITDNRQYTEYRNAENRSISSETFVQNNTDVLNSGAQISYLITENESGDNILNADTQLNHVEINKEYYNDGTVETDVTQNMGSSTENRRYDFSEDSRQTFRTDNTYTQNVTENNNTAGDRYSLEQKVISAFSLLENIMNGEVISRIYQDSRQNFDNRQYNGPDYGYQALENEININRFYSETNIDNSADIEYFSGEQNEGSVLSEEERDRLIEKQISRINEKNIEKLQKMQEIESRKPVIKDITVDRKKARQNLIRSLENPVEVLKEITEKGGESPLNQINRQVTNELYENFSEEAKQVYEQVMNTPGNYEAKNFIRNFMNMRDGGSDSGEEENGGGAIPPEVREEAWMRLSQEEQALVRNLIFHDGSGHDFEPEQLEHVAEAGEIPADENIPSIIRNIISNGDVMHQDVRMTQVNESHPEYFRTDITYKEVVDMYLSQADGDVGSEAAERVEKAMPSVISNYIRNEFVRNENVHRLVDNVILSNRVQNEISSVNSRSDIVMNSSEIREGDSTTSVNAADNTIIQGERDNVIMEHVTERLEHQTETLSSQIHNENTVSEKNLRERVERQVRQTIQSGTDIPENLKLDYVLHPSEETSRNLETRIIEEVIRNQVNMERILPVFSERQDTHQSVSLVHKEENHEIDEELLNILQKRSENKVHEETVVNRDITENKVVETNRLQEVNHVTNTRLDNIEEIVSRQVRSQMGNISEQVIGKLERRLADERRRHGY